MKKTISLLMSVCLFWLNGVSLAIEAFPKLEKDYFISAGDIVNINVFPADEFSKEVTVQPDGTIEIPLIGSLKVSAMSVSELEKLLTAKFSKYVSNPVITLSVRKFSAYKVAIIGQVQRTGYYDYYEGMKVLDLIASAGGMADYAQTDTVRIFRKTKDEKGQVNETSFKINTGDLLKGDIAKNITLMPGDIVYMPRKKFTTASKWLTDNIIPWTILGTFALTIGIITRGK